MQDSLALVLLPDHRILLPNDQQLIRLYLLNATSKKVPIERADATLLDVGVELRLDERWVLPAYPMDMFCGNSFWQDTLAPRSYCAINLDAYYFYKGTIPVEARASARVGQTMVKSPVFTVLLTPLQLFFLRHPRVPLPIIN
ncbi:hypothetical protein [Hymenobacter latericus]|uniref:hypothetical protein n=1 Tax=Hymenobacter sp. YIM 151858-1 TaxID=2987688 RepID=UPI00222682E1|nr:hypothetical protein [Hymenobacter sp. YIM 151858-1]UYZ58090.1 hypothetical protein OIS50_13600 [Hymenobacter sp. YIM 151858-1]